MLTCIVVWNMHHNKKVHVSIQEKACQHLLFESGKGAVCWHTSQKHEKCRNYELLKKQKTCMMLKFSHYEQCHENEQTSLIMNMHVDYGVEKSLIQLGYKNRRDTHSQLSFFANLLISCMPCLGSPHLMYHIFNLYRGLPFPSTAVLVVSEAALGVLAGNSVQWGEYMDWLGIWIKLLVPVHGQCPHAAFGWRIHCGVEVTELSTNKQHTLSPTT